VWLMGLEPTTLPREVTPSALDFARPILSPPDVTDSDSERNIQSERKRGRAKPDLARRLP